jgi:hypothetical protein
MTAIPPCTSTQGLSAVKPEPDTGCAVKGGTVVDAQKTPMESFMQQLKELTELWKSGVLTDDEFAEGKAVLLGSKATFIRFLM